MEISNNNNYLLKIDSYVYHFYLLSNILYLKITRDSINTISTISENISNFSVSMDASGSINIACINSSGNLILFSNKSNSWKKKIIANLYTNSYKYKNLKIYSTEKNIHVLLLKSDNSQSKYWLILHYVIIDNVWHSNEVAKITTDSNMPFYKTDIDTYQNLHIVYKSYENDKSQLFYKTFNNKYSKWSVAERLSSKGNNVINANLLCDRKNNIYIVWSIIYNKNIKISFLKKKVDSKLHNSWKKVENFPYNISNLTYPILLQHGNNIKLLWKQNSKIHFTATNITKNVWNQIETISIENRNLFPVTYIAYKNNIETIKASLTYCLYTNQKMLIYGIDSMDPDNYNSENYVSPNKNHVNDNNICIRKSFSKYLQNVEKYFDNRKTIENLIPEILENNKANLYNSDTINAKDINNKLLDLYDEIHDLKDKEILILNSLLNIRTDYNKLFDKVENILKGNNLQNHTLEQKNQVSFNKIIDLFNRHTYSDKANQK
ncbi:hypothetical protein [Wukongibacter sp. M2B1]|uniref:hypothetical protein n=1 Tax=Wukongibacter sp. M2B1 TaxID=3088895 RepID=UPI003D7BA899